MHTHCYILHPLLKTGSLNLICCHVFTELKLATGPYKASRDAYVAATATYTKSLYE